MWRLLRLLHALYVVFVLLTPPFLLSLVLQRRSLRPWLFLQILHIATILFVILQYGFGWPCPLSVLENRMRGLPEHLTFLPELSGHWMIEMSALVYLLCSLVLHGYIIGKRREAL